MWKMLAHGQGELLNAARLAAALGLSGNTGKRVVKLPKVYIRDSGLLHCLANIPDLETLLGHPVCGRSWEGFVVEQVMGATDKYVAMPSGESHSLGNGVEAMALEELLRRIVEL